MADTQFGAHVAVRMASVHGSQRSSFHGATDGKAAARLGKFLEAAHELEALDVCPPCAPRGVRDSLLSKEACGSEHCQTAVLQLLGLQGAELIGVRRLEV